MIKVQEYEEDGDKYGLPDEFETREAAAAYIIREMQDDMRYHIKHSYRAFETVEREIKFELSVTFLD